MERGTPFPHYQLPKSNSEVDLDQHNNNPNPTLTNNANLNNSTAPVQPQTGLDLDQHDNNNQNPTLTRNANMNNSTTPVQPQTGMVREQDQYMPIANVIRIMRRILPLHAKISDDAKETVQECVSEYISFVTGEANERCQREKRKTVTAEDIMYAMEKLGFEDYLGPLELFINRYREFESGRECSFRGESSSSRPTYVGNGVGFNGSPYDPHHALVHGPASGPTHGPVHGPPYGPTQGPIHGPSHDSVHGLAHGPVHIPAYGTIHGPFHGPFYGPSYGPPSPGSYNYGMLDQSIVMSGGRFHQNGQGQDEACGSGGHASLMPFFDQYGNQF